MKLIILFTTIYFFLKMTEYEITMGKNYFSFQHGYGSALRDIGTPSFSF